MLEIGVKTIVFSVTDSIIKMRLSDYKPSRISLGRQFIQNGYVTIYRDCIEKRQIKYTSDSSSDSSSVSSDTTISNRDSVLSKKKWKKRKKKYR